MLDAHGPLAAWLKRERGGSSAGTAEFGHGEPRDGDAEADAAERAEYCAAMGAARRAEHAASAASATVDAAPAGSACASAGAAAAASGDDLAWLREQCLLRAQALGGGSQTEADITAATLLNELSGGKSDEELQGELLDMLGFEAFEFIAALLARRAAISAGLKRLLAAAAGAAATDAAAAAAARRAAGPARTAARCR